jgi:predicted nucleotidyltransferase
MDINLKKEITNRLISQKLYKVVLFGSQAADQATKNSDIDLLVVTMEDYIPKSFQERSNNYLKISRLFRDMNKKIPIDILVMTKAQWHNFTENRSGFARELLDKGIELI